MFLDIMDIRNYFTKRTAPEQEEDNSPVKKNKQTSVETPSPVHEPLPGTSGTCQQNFDLHDLGLYINNQSLTDSFKYKLLKQPYLPDSQYNFKKDLVNSNRCFKISWLSDYEWMVYSPKLKGALCKFCVVFKPVVNKGVLGAFIIKEFSNYKKLHESAKSHQNSEWHKQSVCKATNFMKIVSGESANVHELINVQEQTVIMENRNKLKPILSTILFCGTHDIALRGKHSQEGNFNDLLRFRIESGDECLNNHLKTCHKKQKYTSVQIQNTLIEIAGDVIRQKIISEVNDSEAFSLLADETADISGHEQLSLGIRFVDKEYNIREEFLGFEKLTSMDAKTIASTIINFVKKHGINLQKLVGLGFDGCSTMAGKDNGVQKLIRDDYPHATYFHCSSHKLNLVVNDLNTVQQIQNTIGTIKEVINFFRDSPKRRNLVTNIPLLSETRWTAKYKSLRIFSENFLNIRTAMENISTDPQFNTQTRTKANILLSSISNSVFLICLK